MTETQRWCPVCRATTPHHAEPIWSVDGELIGLQYQCACGATFYDHSMEKPKRRKPHKYHAKRTTVDGITFDSKKEAERYSELRLMEKAEEIANLQLQVLYPLKVNDQLICSYKADFVYLDRKTKRTVVEDCKGFRTREYQIKRKLMAAIYGIEIVEV